MRMPLVILLKRLDVHRRMEYITRKLARQFFFQIEKAEKKSLLGGSHTILKKYYSEDLTYFGPMLEHWHGPHERQE